MGLSEVIQDHGTAQQRQALLVEQSPIGIIEWDIDGRVITWNRAAEQIFGYTSQEALGQSGPELLVLPRHQARFYRLWQKMVQSPTPLHGWNTNRTKDGRLITCEWYNSALYDADGKVLRVISFCMDITERKRNEDALREQSRFEKLLTNLSAEIINAGWAQMPDAIHSVMGRIAGFLDVDRVALYDFAIDQSHTDVILEYIRHDNPARIRGISRKSFPWFFERMEQGQPVVVKRLADLPPEAANLRALLESIGQKSYLCVPVMAHGLVLGAIGLANYQHERAWPPELVDRLRVIAEVLVNGLARSQAEEAEHNQRILAEALRDSVAALNSTLDLEQVFDNILGAVNRVVPSDTVDLQFMDETGRVRIVREKGYRQNTIPIDIQTWSSHCLALPPLAEMIRTQQPVLVPDTLDAGACYWNHLPETNWIRSYAGAPMISRGQVVGFVNLGSLTSNFFKPEHVERLRLFTDHAAVAFTNARLVEELRQANEQMQGQLADIQALQHELREQAIRDPLTGLFNRRYLQETLEREIARASRESLPIGIIELDIDDFKRINDTCGHPAGDQMLKALSGLLVAHVRQEDMVCRYGGEEFVIVMPGAGLGQSMERAMHIRAEVEQLCVNFQETSLRVTLSVGVSAYPLHGTSADQVLLCADQALYRAKERGRNRVEVFSKPE